MVHGGANYDDIYSVVQTTDGGYATVGETHSFGPANCNMNLTKYTSYGILSWSKTWVGTGSEWSNSFVQTSDGGFAITGGTNSYGAGVCDMFLAKYTSNGTLSWTKTWGGTGDDGGLSLFQASDGGFVIGGYTDSYGAGDYDMLFAKFTSNGIIKNCSSPMCQSPTATVTTPTATTTSPSVTVINSPFTPTTIIAP